MNEQVSLDIDAATPATVCEHCHEPFTPRTGSGGKPQRFCTDKCRKSFHKAEDVGGDVGDVGNKPEPPAFKPLPASGDSNEFSWNVDDLVVIPHQAAIAVYFNPSGDVVIRQEGHYGPDEDSWVVVSKENLVPLILRLQEMSGEFK